MDNKLIARVRKMEDDFNMVRDIMDDMESAVYNFEAVQRRITVSTITWQTVSF